MNKEKSSKEFFEAKYQKSTDPWAFGTSEYEQSRYSSIMEWLTGWHFKRGFEPGCSIGVLTARLAAICQRLDAMDISPTAVTRASERCRLFPNVSIVQGAIPDDMPDATFDLIVFSEIGYYFREDQLSNLLIQLVSRLEPNGVFIAAHWLGESADHELNGADVHRVLRQMPAMAVSKSQCFSGYCLERWTRI